jgi:hypothetical protein
MKQHLNSIAKTRKLQSIAFTVLGAILSALLVAGMIYLTYIKAPTRP